MAQRLLIDFRDGIGFRDYTNYLYDSDQFIRQVRNEPTLFDFTLVPVGDTTAWKTPSRGAYVLFEDSRWESLTAARSGVLFTGYITDEPTAIFLGVGDNNSRGWAYQVKASSEEYLLNAKQLPVKTYIDKSRGYILRDLIYEMFGWRTGANGAPEIGVTNTSAEKVWTFAASGSVYTDVTTAAGNTTPADITLGRLVGDMLYIGMSVKFSQAFFDLSTNATGAASSSWEYSTGSGAWQLLLPTYIGATSNVDFTLGDTYMTWSPPTDWLKDTVNSTTYYWIRRRITSQQSVAPVLTRIIVAKLNSYEILPFDTSQIMDGGNERIYQIDPSKHWSEIAKEFGEADRYVYWFLDGRAFYQPESRVAEFVNDPKYRLVIDEYDPRFRPDQLDIKRVSTSIVNDVTVVGADEPGARCTEYFVSDGYQPYFPLAYEPYGLTENVLIEDTFATSIDSGKWREVDTVQDYIQVYQGRLNVLGGTGVQGETYLLARKGIELSGVLEIRDGEFTFNPASATGTGIIGGMYTSETLTEANLICGWKIYLTGTSASVHPWGPSGEELAVYPITKSDTVSYVFRRTMKFDSPFRDFSTYVASDGKTYTKNALNATAQISWSIEVVDATDPNNVKRSTVPFASATYSNVEDFVIYSPVNSYDLHCVMNNVRVARPQQMQVTIDGIVQPNILGNYLDGGRCLITVEDGKARLNWYSIKSTSSALSYSQQVRDMGPRHYWRLGEAADPIVDTMANANDGYSAGVTYAQTGALAGDANGCMTFNGTSGYAAFYNGITVTGTNPVTLEAWIKTSKNYTGSVGTIWSNDGLLIGLDANNKPHWREADVSKHAATRAINDGVWHHVVFTHDGGTASKIYIDGLLDSSASWSRTTRGGSVTLGKYVTTGLYYFDGSIDEVALYDKVLTPDEVSRHYRRGVSAAADFVTIPPAGTQVTVAYYRKEKAKARLTNLESIDDERARFRDNGIRQHIVREGDISPKPRNTEECLLLAQAYLYDRSTHKWEGSYTFETQENGTTDLRIWPRPGDSYWCQLTLPDSTISQWLPVENVSSEFLGKGVYRLSLEFGAVNYVDARLRELILKRSSSLDEPSIQDVDAVDIDDVSTLDSVRPNDIEDIYVYKLTSTKVWFSVTSSSWNSTDAAANKCGFEVRTLDGGWGQGGEISYTDVTGSMSPTPDVGMEVNRYSRDMVYFFRVWKRASASDPKTFCQRTSMMRVSYPLPNTTTVSSLSGDLTASNITIVIGLPSHPDFGGIIVRRDSTAGPVIYEGDGITHLQLMGSAIVLREGRQVTIQLPNVNNDSSYTVYVQTKNLIGELGSASNTTLT